MPILEVITVGFPFCAFKIMTGLWLQGGGPAARLAGWVLLFLGVLDLLINTINLVGLVALRRRIVEPCLFAMGAGLSRFGGSLKRFSEAA